MVRAVGGGVLNGSGIASCHNVLILSSTSVAWFSRRFGEGGVRWQVAPVPTAHFQVVAAPSRMMFAADGLPLYWSNNPAEP